MCDVAGDFDLRKAMRSCCLGNLAGFPRGLILDVAVH